MSIGRNREEQELTAHLAKTLVMNEVIKPMDKIGWSHAAPPPPEAGQPAPTEGAPGKEAAPAPAAKTDGQPVPKPAAEPAPTDQPKVVSPESIVADLEALRDQKTGLIAGKYKTVNEALKGNAHLASMAKQAYSERDRLLQRVAELEARGVAPAAPAAIPQPRALPSKPTEALERAQKNLDAVLSRVSDNGGVFDAETSKAFSEATRDVANASAEASVQSALAASKQAETAEQAAWKSVDDYMRQNHPDAENFETEIGLHIESNPLLKAAMNALYAQGKRIEATELAWTSLKQTMDMKKVADNLTTDREKEDELAAREKVRQEQVEKARRDAGIVTGSGGSGIHEGGDMRPTREHIASLAEAMRREGDAPGSPAAAAFRRAVIPLDPTVFGLPQ